VPQQPSDLRDVFGRRLTVPSIELLVAVHTHVSVFKEPPALGEIAGLLDCRYERVRKIGMRYERRGLFEIRRERPYRLVLTDAGRASLLELLDDEHQAPVRETA
jgi:hypothetical protein